MLFCHVDKFSAETSPLYGVRVRRLWPLWLGLLLLVFISGCAAGLDSGQQQSSLAADEALLSIYLETQGTCASDLTLQLSNFVLRSDQGEIPLSLDPVTVERGQAQGRQLLLGLATAPEGYYGELAMAIEVLGKADSDGLGQPVTLRFSKTLLLEGGDSQVLFVTWHLDDCHTGEDFTPKFSARGQGEPLSGDLLYALCSDINTLYLVRTDTRFVTAAIGLDGRAAEMVVDPQRRLLYLLNSSRHSLQVFDLATHRLIDRIPLPLTLEPAHLALDVVGNNAFVSDPKARRVVKIDLDSGQMVAHQQVGLQPGRLIYFEQDGVGLVAVCASRTQQVFLLNADTLMTQRTLNTGLQPVDLLISDGLLYVSEAGSRAVTIFSVADGRQVGQVRMVGTPGEMLASSNDDKVYVSLGQTGHLAVLGSGQFTSLRSIPVGDGAGALALSNRRGQLFVTNPAARTVTVLDRASERPTDVVPLGAVAMDLAVFE